MSTRRRFMRAALSAGFAAPLLVTDSMATVDPRPLSGAAIAGAPRRAPVRLGVASYSLRALSRTDAIAVMKSLRAEHVSVKSFHLAYDADAAEIARARNDFEAAGIRVVGGGLVPLNENDEATMRGYFDYAKAAGFPLMVISATPESLPMVERFVKTYDIKVAIHNHGPEDQIFPAPSDALRLIRDMDPRVGLCVDVGHTARTGKDVVREIAEAGPRVLDIHMKDLADLSVKESQCVVGEGQMPIPDIFRQLEAMGYGGYVNLEYEIDEQDPGPGMQRSFAYMRGVLAGMGSR